MNTTGKNRTVTRFAPSPTGYLHLGHAYSALFSWAAAGRRKGRFLLRIEDIDGDRCRAEFETAIFEDLAWLGEGLEGFAWDEPVRRQSQNMADYAAALSKLEGLGVLYPCFCTRAEIRAEIEAAARAPQADEEGPRGPRGPGGAVYPGTCRRLAAGQRDGKKDKGQAFALRLDMAKALALAGPLGWQDLDRGRVAARPGAHGDVVLARKDVAASYHLAVTVDDHLQGISLVTRGSDLFEATHIHRLLQALLGLATPAYHHHRLLRDPSGRRLAKRDQALTLRALRAAGLSPAAVRDMARALST